MSFSPKSLAQCNGDSEHCASLNNWHISAAIGIGVVSNPLHGGDNIPLIVLPNIHYYGEQFFIENNQLGYSFYQSEQLVISIVTQLNREKMFFNDWQPSHLFVQQFSESAGLGPSFQEPSDKLAVDKSDVSKRKWAIDSGVQLNWFASDSINIEAKLLHDISNVYHGFNGQLSVYKKFQHSRWANTQFTVGAGVNWQSKAQANYYYGLSEDDNVGLKNLYQANSGIQPFISLNLAHNISKSWQLKFALKHELLDDNLTDSPLIEDNHISSAFIGVVYAF